MANKKQLKVTSIKEIQELVNSNIVELSPFCGEEPFCVKLSRPSILTLVQKGNVPNTLIPVVNNLFVNGLSSLEDEGVSAEDTLAVFQHMAEAAMVEPSYQELREAGVELTDQQLLEIWMYTQKGVGALELFR